MGTTVQPKAWVCRADIYSKEYPGPGGARPERSWRDLWRAQVPVRCSYTCTRGDEEVTLEATHTTSYWTESDSSLSCLGVDYRRQWVNSGPGYAREIAMPEAKRFVPDDSSPAAELRELARKHR